MAMNPVVLDVSDVSHSYGSYNALQNVSFRIRQGQFVILLGHNGAGKTTLFSLITRLYHNSSGAIAINGYNVRKHPTKALRSLGVVFQQRSLDLDLSVEQNLYYSVCLQGMLMSQVQESLDLHIERLGLSSYYHKKVRHLSGGQARCVECVRALIHRPRMLILDEPTVGIDIQSRKILVDYVRDLCKSGVSVLWATHLIDEVDKDDMLLILKKGCLQQFAKTSDLGADAKSYEGLRKALMRAF